MRESPATLAKLWSWLATPSARYSVLTLLAGGFVAGVVFWGGFNTAMEATNTREFCITCHEMRENVYREYAGTIHYQNRTGVSASCSDCHVPNPWVHKVARKIQASNELYHWAMGSIDTKEKFEAKRLQLAMRVWESMKATDSRECRNCHTLQSMNPEFQRPRARKLHLDAMQTGQTCIDCHKGIAHKSPRDQVSEAVLEAMEKPDPAFARPVPATFSEGLRRIEQREAADAARRKQEADAAEAALKGRIDQAVAQALASRPAAPSPAAPAAASGAAAPSAPTQTAAAAVIAGVDWSSIEAVPITLFYPGQASFEWVQTGRDHGGARPFTRAGDRCATCHLKEAKDMGAKIVAGQKAEATPIPGKRPSIDVRLQAAHDGSNLFLRFEWPDAPHAPVPFAAGGKLDPQNQSKLAVMIAGTGIERVDQAGCWATCHHDSRSMPDAPKPDAAKASSAAAQLDLKDGVTKYLAESRAQIEIQGRDGQPRGGWDKPKAAAELEALAKAGSFMDLFRWQSGGPAQNGHVLAERIMSGGGAIEAEGTLANGTWTVVLKRPLKPGQPGDIAIEPGKTYTVGIAIHDDHANARFHHVSLEYRLGLDSADTEINVKKR